MAARPGRAYLAGAPLLVAHRGGAALAPENTLDAFRHAVDVWGADMLEMDVRLTRDGEVVVIHDDTVDRTTDGTGPVAGFDYAALADFDAGACFLDPDGAPTFAGCGVRIPRFDDVIRAFPGVRLNVEAKEPRVAAPLVEVVRHHGAEHRVLVAAEFERCRDDARGYAGPWGASRHQVFGFWLGQRVLGRRAPWIPPVDAFQVPERIHGLTVVTPGFVRAAHRNNIPVHVWTVDDPDRMRMLLDMGVDGIQTDRPDLLARVLHETRGRPLPPGLRSQP